MSISNSTNEVFEKFKRDTYLNFKNIQNYELHQSVQEYEEYKALKAQLSQDVIVKGLNSIIKSLENQLARERNEHRMLYVRNQDTLHYYDSIMSEMREQIISLQVSNQTLKLSNDIMAYKMSSFINCEECVIKNLSENMNDDEDNWIGYNSNYDNNDNDNMKKIFTT